MAKAKTSQTNPDSGENQNAGRNAASSTPAAVSNAAAAPTPAPTVQSPPTDMVASQDPRGTADASRPEGEAERTAQATHAEQDQNEGRALTELEALQASAIRSRQAATDGTVSPHSTVVQRPDAEFLADMTNDALTAKREQTLNAARAEGGGSAEELVHLQDQIDEANRELNEVMQRRDRLRDEYDAVVERLQTDQANVASPTVGYIEAMNRQREERARQQAQQQKSAA